MSYAPSVLVTWKSHSISLLLCIAGKVNFNLAFFVVDKSPLGVPHTLGGPVEHQSLSFEVSCSVTRLSAPPLSSRATIVTGFTFPSRVLNLTMDAGLRCNVFTRLAGFMVWPRMRLAIGNISFSWLWLRHSSNVSYFLGGFLVWKANISCTILFVSCVNGFCQVLLRLYLSGISVRDSSFSGISVRESFSSGLAFQQEASSSFLTWSSILRLSMSS